ncbi:MAG: flagellar hook-associated protein FlgK [Bacteriovoracaceae bacterium]
MSVDLLNIGTTGLYAAKKSLQTTGHNIANANTEGYSRQNVKQETSIPIGDSTTVMGSGVFVKDVKRVHDELIEKRVNSTLSNHKFNEERSLQLGQIEDIFNEVDSDGLAHLMNKFFNSFRELAQQPENETVRSIVRENARVVVSDFHRARQTLDMLASNIDKKLAASVDEINLTLQNIANLNIKISNLENAHGETGDLRDQRDLAVKSLAESFQINVYSNEKGQFNVAAEGIGTLISGGQHQELMTGQSAITGNAESSGNVEVFFKTRPTQSLTLGLKEGTLGALVKTKNTELKNQRDRLDDIAFELTHTVNAIHKKGFALQGGSVNFKGEVKNGEGRPLPPTGMNFFKEPLDRFRAAEYIQLSDEIKADLNNIATGIDPHTPGDNRIAIAISKLQHEKILGGGTTSFEESYLKTLGDIGLASAKARVDTEQSSGLVAQAKAIKERISGVSIDEETANMVKFQHSYEASARVMKTADEMFKTILDMKR